MKDRLVSIIIPLYNREEYIREAIDSLLLQTYENIEIIVVDDCSTDSGVSIVEAYGDKRIKLIKNKENRGISYTRSRGFDIAKGEYIALLDSDDIAMPNRIATQVSYLSDNPLVGVVGSNRVEFSDKEDIRISKHQLNWEVLKVALLFDMPMTNPSLMMRREVMEEFSYNSKYIVAEDYEFLYRVSKKWRVENIEEPLIRYRIHNNQITKNHDDSSYLKDIKTRIFAELDIEIEDELKDIYYRGINLDLEQAEVEEFSKIIIKILEQNKRLSIYNEEILKGKLLGKLIRLIKRRLKGVKGLQCQKKIKKILNSEGIEINSYKLRILTNRVKI